MRVGADQGAIVWRTTAAPAAVLPAPPKRAPMSLISISAKKLSEGGSIRPSSWATVGESTSASVCAPWRSGRRTDRPVHGHVVGAQRRGQFLGGLFGRGVGTAVRALFAAIEGQAGEHAFEPGVEAVAARGLAAKRVEVAFVALYPAGDALDAGGHQARGKRLYAGPQAVVVAEDERREPKVGSPPPLR